MKFPGRNETLWIGPNNALQACTVRIEQGDVKVEVAVTFAVARVLSDADSASYEAPIPEGYSLSTDAGSQWLTVGADAPDVGLIGRDGETHKPSSLRRLIAFLNFWFYT